MDILISDIRREIQSGINNIDLNVLIVEHISDSTETQILAWKINNYIKLREWAYPDKSEYIDAQVKLNSDIPALVSEGAQQMSDYVQVCLNVKARFPKE